MASTAPTKGATESTPGAWVGRPTIAFTLRSVVLLAPIVACWAAVRLTAGHFWRPSGLLGYIAWAVQVIAVGSAVATYGSRGMRRLLPLVALLQATLVFPDRAPSRFKVALRSGNVKRAELLFDDVRSNGFGADQTDVAERIVELVNALSRHERMTRGHTDRVRAYSDLIAQEMGLSAEDRNKLRWASMLHDIGKLSVPAEILNKPGRPSDEEWAILANHPVVGGEIVESLASWLGEWRLAASQHHERWDGMGYPLKLAGAEISRAGRIVAVADAYDVITSARTYKKPMTPVAARQELVRCSGTQFDPAVVRAFLNVSIGRTRARVGVVGWLVELGKGLGTITAHATSTAGGLAAATALAATAAVAVAPPDLPAAANDAAPQNTELVDSAPETTSTPGTLVTPRSDTATNASGRTPNPTTSLTTSTAASISTTSTAASSPTTSLTASAASPSPTSSSPVPNPSTSPATSAATPSPTISTVASASASAPKAKADNVTVALGAIAVVDVLANDSDPDGDLDPTSLTIDTPPARGTAVVIADRITYATVPGNGNDHFKYQVCDLGGRCSTANVVINYP